VLTCQRCSSECASCLGRASNCTSCISGKLHTAAYGTCTDSCPTRHYPLFTNCIEC